MLSKRKIRLNKSVQTDSIWWTRRESNPRPLQCECSTLPTELRARAIVIIHPFLYQNKSNFYFLRNYKNKKQKKSAFFWPARRDSLGSLLRSPTRTRATKQFPELFLSLRDCPVRISSKKQKSRKNLLFYGLPEEIRTPNRLNRNQMH